MSNELPKHSVIFRLRRILLYLDRDVVIYQDVGLTLASLKTHRIAAFVP